MSNYNPDLMQQRLTTDQRIHMLELEIEKLARDVQAYKEQNSKTAGHRDIMLIADSEDEIIDIGDELTDFQNVEQAEFVKRLLCPERFPDHLV